MKKSCHADVLTDRKYIAGSIDDIPIRVARLEHCEQYYGTLLVDLIDCFED
ncbi:hypothetical protein NGI46_22295 [Peribacillus butanolivorans]|nr:hypothetical protein [Peribacillus butanolivorans]